MTIVDNLAVLELMFMLRVTEVIFFERGERNIFNDVRSKLINYRRGLCLVLFELVLKFLNLLFEAFCL